MYLHIFFKYFFFVLLRSVPHENQMRNEQKQIKWEIIVKLCKCIEKGTEKIEVKATTIARNAKYK